jgi:hypothetical protein
MGTAPQPVVAAARRAWSARFFSLPTVLGMALVSMVFLVTSSDRVVAPLKDPDVYWHLRDAWQLLHTGHFIRSDSWTFTVSGRPWLDFEWLAELPYYFAFRRLGESGLYAVMMILLGAIAFGMYSLARMRCQDAKAAFVAAFLGLDFITVSFGPRTLLFGWLFLIVELAILWSLQEGRDYTAWLPPLFLLWINTHGSWLIGFALMVVYFACGLVGGEWGNVTATRWNSAQIRKFAVVLAASSALLFINPYGWRLVAYPLDVAYQQKLTIEHIQEWFSINFHDFQNKSMLAVLFLFAVLQLVRRRQWKLQDLVFLIIAVYGGFSYVRFLFLLGIVLVPLLAIELAGIVGTPYNPATDRRAPNAVALAVVLAVIAGFWASPKKVHLSIAESFPEKALPWVQSTAGQGNLFSGFEYAAYLEWRAPEVREFIDGRTDIFVHEGVMQDYLDAIHIKDPFEVLDKYSIRYVLIGKGTPLSYLLEHSTAWKTAYQDDRSIGFKRVQ